MVADTFQRCAFSMTRAPHWSVARAEVVHSNWPRRATGVRPRPPGQCLSPGLCVAPSKARVHHPSPRADLRRRCSLDQRSGVSSMLTQHCMECARSRPMARVLYRRFAGRAARPSKQASTHAACQPVQIDHFGRTGNRPAPSARRSYAVRTPFGGFFGVGRRVVETGSVRFGPAVPEVAGYGPLPKSLGSSRPNRFSAIITLDRSVSPCYNRL